MHPVIDLKARLAVSIGVTLTLTVRLINQDYQQITGYYIPVGHKYLLRKGQEGRRGRRRGREGGRIEGTKEIGGSLDSTTCWVYLI